MQTTFDIPANQLSALDQLSRDRQVPRDDLVREAIVTYIEDQIRAEGRTCAESDTRALDAAFGSWSSTFQEDGLTYQQRLRDEW